MLQEHENKGPYKLDRIYLDRRCQVKLFRNVSVLVPICVVVVPQDTVKTRAGTIHDSKNRESIQNPDFRNFRLNHESTIRQNERILLLKGSIQNPDFQVNCESTIRKYY